VEVVDSWVRLLVVFEGGGAVLEVEESSMLFVV
jgi:hypothetical protein